MVLAGLVKALSYKVQLMLSFTFNKNNWRGGGGLFPIFKMNGG